MATSSAIPVPSPPNTASVGIRRPRTVTEPGLIHGRSASGWVTRSLITARCAIVNESIAPNA